ncbi:MAG: hypothetical protein C5B54_11160, partial [Acidobacteria bacterium]
AAAPAWTLAQIKLLLENINSDAMPKVMIFALDPPWFNDHYIGDSFPAPVNDFQNIFLANRSFLRDILKGEKFNIEFYVKRIEPGSGRERALGLRAIRDGHGFRNDGSEQYGDFLMAHWLSQGQQRQHHLDLMRNGKEIYPFGDEVSKSRLDLLRSILNIARQHKIFVIGFLPSYMPTLWQEMIQNKNDVYISKVTKSLQSVFREYKYPFHDYSNGSWCGAKDDDFFDGWHASERANLQLYMDIVSKEPVLQTYSDCSGLAKVLQNATSTWNVFGNN